MTRKAGTIAVGHIGLNVSDLDISEAFYQEVLGFRVADEFLQSPFRHASMARDGKTVLTLWEQSCAGFGKPRPGLHHLSFEADSVEQVTRTKGLLENLGASWKEGPLLYGERSGSVAIHFEDPDGVRIEVYSAGRRETSRAEKSEEDAQANLSAALPALSAS
jgi:lactoylglutathione lyase